MSTKVFEGAGVTITACEGGATFGTVEITSDGRRISPSELQLLGMKCVEWAGNNGASELVWVRKDSSLLSGLAPGAP